MCFGGKKQESPSITYLTQAAPTVTPAPAPAPLPSPSPTKVGAASIAEQRRRRIGMMRHGLLSTIKTSPRGLTGTGSNLISRATGAQTLGG